MMSDLRLLKQHIQVPIQVPKDFISVILEKGEENKLQLGQQVEGSEVGDCRASEGLGD